MPNSLQGLLYALCHLLADKHFFYFQATVEKISHCISKTRIPAQCLHYFAHKKKSGLAHGVAGASEMQNHTLKPFVVC